MSLERTDAQQKDKMNPNTRKMYEKMYNILFQKFLDHNLTINALAEFIAVDNYPSLLNQLNHKFEWLYEDKELCENLLKVYNLSLLKSDPYDYLGDLYVNKQTFVEKNTKGRQANPDLIADFISRITFRNTNGTLNILDPCVGTGSFLLAASKHFPNANFFGVDSDLTALRIAFTNCAIHKINAYFLHADIQTHEIDISKPDGIYNWQYANHWYSCMDKLRKISPGKSPRNEFQQENDRAKIIHISC